MSNLIVTTLDKFNLSTTNIEKWKLLQRTDDGKELSFPSNSAIFHCVSGYTGIIMLIGINRATTAALIRFFSKKKEQ